jgi:hypothetical protein
MAARARWMALAGAAGLTIGIVAGFAARELVAPTPASLATQRGDADEDLREQVDQLRAEVAAQRTLASALQAEISGVRERIEDLEPLAALNTARAGGDEAEAGQAQKPAAPGRRTAGQWFDPGLLLEVDMDPDDIARVRRHFDAHQLEILFLRDRATREGWMHQPRFSNEMQNLKGGLREEVGDADYDALLWATGRPNRVELSALLGGSPAVDAGLEDGDIVLRYDDQEIYHALGLQRATRTGDSGSTVSVDVLRGDEELRVYLPRGPLGAQLKPAHTSPRSE